MFALLPSIPNVYYGTESYHVKDVCYVSSPRIVLSQVGGDCLVIFFEMRKLLFISRFKPHFLFRKDRKANVFETCIYFWVILDLQIVVWSISCTRTPFIVFFKFLESM